jgi:hypothetical protein
MFPHRSGGQVSYLEQAFPKPAFLLPASFAFFTVVFSFVSSNSVGTSEKDPLNSIEYH